MRRSPRRMRSCGGQAGDVLAEEADAPGGRREVPGDGVEERRLAGAVGAQHGAALAGGHRHGDARERHQRAEVPRHALEIQRVGAGPLQAVRRQSGGAGIGSRAGRVVAADGAQRQELGLRHARGSG